MIRCAHRVATIAGVLLWLGLVPATTMAGTSRARRVHSFAGRCSIRGTARFTPPVTPMQPGPATLVNNGSGSCRGTLDGKRIKNAPVVERSKAPVYADGCLAAHTTSPGHGTFTFRDGVAIRFRFEFSGALTEYPVRIQGDRSGSAHGLANFVTTRDPSRLTFFSGAAGSPEASGRRRSTPP